MRVIRVSVVACLGLALFVAVSASFGQIVINEVVKEERTAGSSAITPDAREFVELYNAGASPVDISNWTLGTYDLTLGAAVIADTIPSGSMIAPGGFFVVGAVGVPNVNFSPIPSGEIYPDLAAHVLELRDASGVMQDAVAYEIFRTGATGLTLAAVDQIAQIGSGFQGQLLSMNAAAPNTRESWSRYRDGRDTNSNGRDFGVLPLTPGTSNNLPLNPSHTIPDVDGMTTGATLSAAYHASFVLPRVIDPGVVNTANPRAIPASPQGGKAITAWDETGGGNVAYSKDLVNKFDLYAYFDTAPIGVAPLSQDEEWESQIYGIGSSDAFFGNPDPTGGIFIAGTVTQNASTGIGWLYQQYEEESDTVDQPPFTKLMLVDFGDGGDSMPDAGEWNIIQEIDMSTMSSGWYRLGIDYDPTTGAVTATFDDQTFNFNTATDLLGTFFVGYREALTDVPGANQGLSNPPTYDLFVDAGLTGDYNDDGTVDAADYVVWRNDPAGNGGAQGYTDWAANFGKTAASGSGSTFAAVPEPTSVALFALGILAIAAKRRHP